ncbi:MAG: 30S ribosome-binding factor RbfA [Candidatus Omnitrophica bacterium]|nr:30S ribosome-binding factor RbfA [Candidatus Omnitrophota bacterium]
MDRIDRVNEQIKREIGVIIQQELADPRLRFVTITNVDVSRDLRTAKVYFSALADRLPSAEGSGDLRPRGGGENSAAQAAKKALESATGIIRRRVGENVKMRYTPELHFIYDRSVEFGARVEQTLTEIHHDETGKSPKRAAKA